MPKLIASDIGIVFAKINAQDSLEDFGPIIFSIRLVG